MACVDEQLLNQNTAIDSAQQSNPAEGVAEVHSAASQEENSASLSQDTTQLLVVHPMNPAEVRKIVRAINQLNLENVVNQIFDIIDPKHIKAIANLSEYYYVSTREQHGIRSNGSRIRVRDNHRLIPEGEALIFPTIRLVESMDSEPRKIGAGERLLQSYGDRLVAFLKAGGIRFPENLTLNQKLAICLQSDFLFHFNKRLIASINNVLKPRDEEFWNSYLRIQTELQRLFLREALESLPTHLPLPLMSIISSYYCGFSSLTDVERIEIMLKVKVAETFLKLKTGISGDKSICNGTQNNEFKMRRELESLITSIDIEAAGFTMTTKKALAIAELNRNIFYLDAIGFDQDLNSPFSMPYIIKLNRVLVGLRINSCIESTNRQNEMEERKRLSEMEALRQTGLRQGTLRQERLRQEALRQEALRPEVLLLKALHQEALCQEASRQEALRQKNSVNIDDLSDEDELSDGDEISDEDKLALAIQLSLQSVKTGLNTPASTGVIAAEVKRGAESAVPKKEPLIFTELNSRTPIKIDRKPEEILHQICAELLNLLGTEADKQAEALERIEALLKQKSDSITLGSIDPVTGFCIQDILANFSGELQTKVRQLFRNCFQNNKGMTQRVFT